MKYVLMAATAAAVLSTQPAFAADAPVALSKCDKPIGSIAVVDDASVAVSPFVPLQIIGEAGHGKTTHLLALHARLPLSRYEYVPIGQDHFFSELPSEGVFLLDEAQRVKAKQLRALFVTQPLLVLGTHADLQPYCPHPLRTLRLESLSLAKLRSVVNARFLAARLDARASVPTLDDVRLAGLLLSHGANLRAIEQTLYDWVQDGKL